MRVFGCVSANRCVGRAVCLYVVFVSVCTIVLFCVFVYMSMCLIVCMFNVCLFVPLTVCAFVCVCVWI